MKAISNIIKQVLSTLFRRWREIPFLRDYYKQKDLREQVENHDCPHCGELSSLGIYSEGPRGIYRKCMYCDTHYYQDPKGRVSEYRLDTEETTAQVTSGRGWSDL